MSGQFDIEAGLKQLQAIVADERLPQAVKRKLAKPLIDRADKEQLRIEADLAVLQAREREARRILECLKDVEDWLCRPPLLQLERNDFTRLHKLKEAAQAGKIVGAEKEGEGAENEVSYAELLTLGHTFVVKHDWASAFAKAEDFLGGEIRLPYEDCAFEFRLSGRTVILWTKDFEGQQRFSTFIEAAEGWYRLSANAGQAQFVQFMWQQVRAICVALDAQVAVDVVKPAARALNEKRQRNGKPPLSDFHIVDLARRYQGTASTGGSCERHVRLHFRRGHWRHYDERRTWIRWCLVGDPDLGFVSKHYAL